ncbi:MAG TPA: PBP1A family penicillin-binding protein [Gaiellaceae bacterium]|nr:PBP1A family penicillin-binding protein [Gaiellaceae bacterium]
MLLRRRRREPGKRRRRIRKLRFLALTCVLLLVASVSFAYGFVSAIASELSALEPGRENRAERIGYIYASDGRTVLAVLRGSESRILVGSDEIAPLMKQAIVAVEDRRFWEHRGVDIRGMARAFWADVRHKQVVQGGSTITQQFVKNQYARDERTVGRKLKEAALAWQLEQRWSKQRILTAYLNTIYFGNGAYGVEMASRVYFDKRAKALSLPEAALLAGIPANPNAYDPASNPEAATARRETVLRLMLEQGLITAHDFDTAVEAPLPAAEDIGLPGSRGRGGHFAEYVKQQLIPYYGSAEVFGGGLRIYTSIDLELQRIAREAIGEWLSGPGGPTAALVAVDPRDGRVLAMVGGESFRKSQFNLAVQGQRQTGSAFKPFVLAAALEQGIAPQTVFESEPTVINLGDKLWPVANYEGAYLGRIDLVEATVHSDNAVYAQLTAQVGPRNVTRMARKLGVTRPLDDYFAVGLGVEAVSPLEMARAFATFAANGARVDGTVLGNVPRAVLRVEDGRRVDSNDALQRQVLDANDAALLNSILEDAVEEGTGERAQLAGRPVAGKTGTTENYGDAWFVGYTPQLAVAVWVGYPHKLQPMTTEFDGEPVAGGTYPALIWRTFAERALRHLQEPPEHFPAPVYEEVAPQQVVHRGDRWLLDNGNCRDAREIVFFVGSEPAAQAPCKPNEVDVPKVVGARRALAEARLLTMPLTPEVIWRPAEPGEELGRVTAQVPAGGTLSSWDTVRIVLPKAVHGRIPDVVGLPLARAREALARRGVAGVVEAYADGSPAGTVVTQIPRGGRAAVPNMTVRLVVTRG